MQFDWIWQNILDFHVCASKSLQYLFETILDIVAPQKNIPKCCCGGWYFYLKPLLVISSLSCQSHTLPDYLKGEKWKVYSYLDVGSTRVYKTVEAPWNKVHSIVVHECVEITICSSMSYVGDDHR